MIFEHFSHVFRGPVHPLDYQTVSKLAALKNGLKQVANRIFVRLFVAFEPNDQPNTVRCPKPPPTQAPQPSSEIYSPNMDSLR